MFLTLSNLPSDGIASRRRDRTTRSLPDRLRGAMRASVAVMGLGIVVIDPASAQSFLGRGAPQALAVPDEGAEPPAPQRSVAKTEASASTAIVTPPPQQPLPAISGSLRLSGEESSIQWPVYLTAEQVRERLRFRIGYLAAISVVPEASFLIASVNDTPLGRTAIKAPGAVKVIEFDVPAGALKPGYNAVTIAGVQRHRVDCSLQATYELWTQIDPSWTGFVMPAGVEAVRGLRDLAAVSPDVRGIVPIRVVLRNRPNFPAFERIIALLQRIALSGRYSHVSVDFGQLQPNRVGLNLVIGTPDELRDLPGLDAGEITPGHPLTFLPPTANRATTMVVSASLPTDLDAASEAVRSAGTRDLVGSPQGLQVMALTRGGEVQGGETVRLARFGVQNREFSGRLFRAGFDVALPADFVPADYAKATLALAGGYAAGLDIGAQIIVDLNGRNVASTVLPRAEGDIFRDEQISLPLGRWRPGRNRVEITALLPTASDQACDEAEVERKRFLFLNETSLTFPRLARALRLPDLAATASGGVPYLSSDRRPRLVIPAPDRDSMSAAATIAVRMALSANRPIDFELANERALERRAPTIVVAPARALDPDVIRAIGINPDQIQQIWQGRAATQPAANALGQAAVDGLSLDRLRNDVPPACVLPSAGPRTAAIASQRPRTTAADAQARDLASSWSAGLRTSSSLGEQLSNGSAKVAAMASGAATAASDWVTDQIREPEIEVSARASLVAGQGMTGPDPNSALTVFTAPNAASLQAATICLTSPSVWNKLQGRVAILDANDGSLSTFAANQTRLIETAPRSFDNSRLVLAGWFSSNPTTFVMILFAAAIALGLSTAAMLRGVGRTAPARRSAVRPSYPDPEEMP